MATVTDLYGSENTTTDNISVVIPYDSNVNVFEFGNLILADILPTVKWLINYTGDGNGSSISVSDSSSVISAISDSSGVSSSVIDISGS